MEIASDRKKAMIAVDGSGEVLEPGVKGLSGFGMAMIFFGLHQLGVGLPGSGLIVGGLILGALWQIGLGLTFWKRGNFWGATFMMPCGFFLLSLLSLVILPVHGWGKGPDNPALASYFVIWGLFNVAIFTGLFRFGLALRLIVGLLAGFCFLMALNSLLSGTLVGDIAVYDGIACGLLAVGVGPARLLGSALKERRRIHEGQD